MNKSTSFRVRGWWAGWWGGVECRAWAKIVWRRGWARRRGGLRDGACARRRAHPRTTPAPPPPFFLQPLSGGIYHGRTSAPRKRLQTPRPRPSTRPTAVRACALARAHSRPYPSGAWAWGGRLSGFLGAVAGGGEGRCPAWPPPHTCAHRPPPRSARSCSTVWLPSIVFRNVNEFPQGRVQPYYITVTPDGVVSMRVETRADFYTVRGCGDRVWAGGRCAGVAAGRRGPAQRAPTLIPPPPPPPP